MGRSVRAGLRALALAAAVSAPRALPVAAQHDGRAPVPSPDTMRVMRMGVERSLAVVPLVFSSPVTGVGFGLDLLGLSAPRGDSTTRPTRMQLALIYTTRSQAIADIQFDIWTRGNRWNLSGQVEGNLYPQPFFGIGPNDPALVGEEFDLHMAGALLRGQRELREGLFLTMGTRLRAWNVDSLLPGGLLATSGVAGVAGGHFVGFEAGLARDTRDLPLNARTGSLLAASLFASSRAWGSGFSWATLTLDGRWYAPVLRGRTLAVQVQAQHAIGDPVFEFMPNLGGPFDLRAYVNNRWRDKAMAFAQAELRTPVWWRFGAVGFAGVGGVARSFGAFRAAELRPSVGLGLRFAIVPARGANVRADFAVGAGGQRAFYLNFGEAF
ncbi:MAG: BamA/TamA family outer membrane protein [Gemmatimonadales bacterium]|nr:BamA/TamA family outer membrane protein [Gemmatimonadales bacterium]